MWTIHLIKNEPIISDECAEELFEIQLYEGETYGELWDDLDDVVYDGILQFNPDHFEHMDFLQIDGMIKILCKHKVNGDICFADLEGSQTNSFWGYRFDGAGGVKKLKGKLIFEEV